MKNDPIRDAFANPVPVDLGHNQGPDFRDDLDPPEGETPPPRDLPDEDAPEARAAVFPLNDFGNGQRLIEYYGENILYVPRLGWYRWGGTRWEADEDAISVRLDAQKIAAHILHEIPFIALDEWRREALDLWHECRDEWHKLAKIKVKDRSDEQLARIDALRDIKTAGEAIGKFLTDAKTAHRGHSKTSGNSSKITNMMAEAAPIVRVSVAELDTCAEMLNCENGVLHFTKIRDEFAESWGDEKPKWQVDLLPHHRDQRITKMVAANYDPAAKCPTWLAFLETVQPDPAMRHFLKLWFGYNLTGRTDEQKLAFFFGMGRNGKSTAMEIIGRIMADYGGGLDIETLTGTDTRKGSDATPDLVQLPGARFVRASEPEQGQRMKESLIKRFTGGEVIRMRRMHSEFVDFIPEFKLTIGGNYRPEIRGSDDGIWRRVLLVPFDQQIPEDEVDRDLPNKLWAERDGILAWMVQGCLEWFQSDLPIPRQIKDATASYRVESDVMRNFLQNECVIAENGTDFTPSSDVRDAFNAWMLSEAKDTWGSRTISLRLAERAGVVKNAGGGSYKYRKTGGVAGYIGLRIKTEAMDRVAVYPGQLRGPGAKS